MHYTVKAHIYAGEKSGYVTECLEFPAVTQGQTLDETVQNLREALGFAGKQPPLVVNDDMESVCA